MFKYLMIAGAIAVSALGTSVSSASAQTGIYEQQVINDLNAITVEHRRSGFAWVDRQISVLRPAEAAMHRITLQSGRTYIISGACDVDCTGLRLRLFDENSNLIEEMAGNDRPLVAVTPRWTGPFVIRLVMSRCSESHCHAGVAVLRR